MRLENGIEEGPSVKGKTASLETVEKIIGVLKFLQERKFTGYIKINFAGGAVVKLEKFEEILKK